MLEKIKPYASYKKSESTWLSEFPDDWEEVSLSQIARLKSVTNQIDRELLSIYLHKGVVRFSDVKEKRTNSTSTNLEKYQAVDPGDFVLNNQQAWRGSVGVSSFSGIVSPAYLVLNLSKRLEPKYANYLFRSPIMVSQYLICSKGVGTIQRNLYWPYLKRVKTVIPSYNTQKDIVKFLDYANGKLDRAIRAKRKTIALLNEQKQAIIHRAVTRGLDPSVPLKPSGIPWLGDIPAHWEIRRLKSFISNITQQTAVMQSDDVYIALEDVEGWTGRFSPKNNTEDVLFSGQVKKFVKGDVLFCKLRPYLAKVISPQCKGVCVGEFLVLRPEDLMNHKFLEILLRTKLLIDVINSSTFGAKMPRADWDFIGNLRIGIPPLTEQIRIVQSIDTAINPILDTISRVMKEIQLLSEYRTRLISDVVTGKLDVREAAKNLPIETIAEPIEDISEGEDEELEDAA